MVLDLGKRDGLLSAKLTGGQTAHQRLTWVPATKPDAHSAATLGTKLIPLNDPPVRHLYLPWALLGHAFALWPRWIMAALLPAGSALAPPQHLRTPLTCA
jgi:hypothetical protein